MGFLSARMHGLWGLLVFLLAVPQVALSTESLSDLDLEALMDLEVTSVSKRVQPLSDSPAAVYVISSQEIRRSGATSLPDALRLAPGVEVARLNSSMWAVSIRGMNSLYSHHLQVLIDGRSIYTPLYGGVYWDLVMPMLEDIDRIEVIRGPGASLWGVNAVNGVVNIITKNPEVTQGTRVVAAAGNQENHLRMRSGGKSGDLFYRGYAVYRDLDDSVNEETGNSADDEMEGAQVGGRIDWVQGKERVTLQSDVSGNEKSFNHTASERVGPAGERFDNLAFNVSGLWTKPLEEDELQLNLYYDYVKRDEPGYIYTAKSYDIDFQYNHHWISNNRFTWGFHYRHFEGEMDGSNIYQLTTDKDVLDIYSAFLQNEYQVTDKLTAVAGLKVEKIEDIDVAWQPTLRFNYRYSTDVSYWGSISRAERSPTIHERYGIFTNEYPDYLREDAIDIIRNHFLLEGLGGFVGGLAGFSLEEILPALLLANSAQSDQVVLIGQLAGNRDMESEKTTTFELGSRWQAADNFFFDLAAHYSKHTDLRALEFVAWEPTPDGFISTMEAKNIAEGRSLGFELATEYRPSADLRVKFHYSKLQVIIDGDNDLQASEFNEGASPTDQFSFRTYWDIDEEYSFDMDFYYVSEITSGGENPPSDYADINFKLSWQATPELNLSFVMLNLLHDKRFEYQEVLIGPQRTEIKRSMYLQLDWKH